MVKKVERQLRGTVKQENITISTDKLKKQLQRVKNWKAPGPDELLGCWIKTFISCHNRMAAQLQLCFEMNEIPNWLTTGKTVLITKDREKGMMSPTLDQKHACVLCGRYSLDYLVRNDLIIKKTRDCCQRNKRCRRKSKGTKDQLIIDKILLRNCKIQMTRLGIA